MNSQVEQHPSPFHTGEQQVQERLGVRDKIEAFAQRVVRDHLPDQHREFYQQLPFLILGSVDGNAQPWASMVTGRPGFITSPDERTLNITASPLFGDPLNVSLRPGAEVGVLGIDPKTRRRNRLTGRIGSVRPGGFTIVVDQTFGNCPQYIQTRTVEILPKIESIQNKRSVDSMHELNDATRTLIERSDTLFIASAYSDGEDTASNGADVSHRGGKPGFVRIEDKRTFVFPDFSGNNHFNTVGNIVLNPKVGFLFIDFETGDLVYMTGEAEIIWGGPEVQAFTGAERLIRFRADKVIRVENSLPLRFDFGEFSPMLDHTGSWVQTAETLAAEKERNDYIPFEVFDVRRESDEISSFCLRRKDGKALASHRPGQFLPIRLNIPGKDETVTRTYTVSDAPNGEHYRLSIKREGGDALVSNFFHQQIQPGFQLEAMAPRGRFVLDQSTDRPVVLISGGVGITPMMAMTNSIIKEGLRTRKFRRTFFIHGTRSGKTHAFSEQIHQLATQHENLTSHIRYSRPNEDDRLGSTYDSEGYIDIALLKDVLSFDDYDFYLCGPPSFMQAIYDGLTGLGVRDERIHYESFGPATVLKHDALPSVPDTSNEPVDGPVTVRFANAEIEVEWSPDKGTLLELAEAAGLQPAFSCRSGNCGTCAVRLKCGAVNYLEEPIGPHGDDEVLICCSTPRSLAEKTTCGKDHGVVLDL